MPLIGRSSMLTTALVGVIIGTARAEPASPVVTDLFPPAVAVGGRETWTIRGRNLSRVERIDVEGGGIVVTLTKVTDREVVAEAKAQSGVSPGFREVRVDGPDGVSNLRLVRVDRSGQTTEREPNDTAETATPLPFGLAGGGVLTSGDLDHFRVEGKAGRRVTIEVEARRLGTPVASVVTVMTPGGNALAQGRETPGVSGDCRFLYTFPADGPCVIQVRDNLYLGSETANYRLRVTDEPFATGLFPLGGPPGETIGITASGGNLSTPVSRAIKLPEQPGTVVEVPSFAGSIESPARIIVGVGPERQEGDTSVELAQGETVNGRISRPGEVDRFPIEVKADQDVRLQVVADPLGSWLDSVVTMRDPRGRVVAENDDVANDSVDSLVEFRPKTGETLSIELTDRFGRGGPEYAYRLTRAPARPDFHVRIVSSEPGHSQGAFNVPAGSEVVVKVEVRATGRPGPVMVRAVDLPAGISCEPVTVRPQARPGASAVAFGQLVMKADRDAGPVFGRFRVEGSGRGADGKFFEREGSAVVAFELDPVNAPRRRVEHWVKRFPVRVVAGSSKGSE